VNLEVSGSLASIHVKGGVLLEVPGMDVLHEFRQ